MLTLRIKNRAKGIAGEVGPFVTRAEADIALAFGGWWGDLADCEIYERDLANQDAIKQYLRTLKKSDLTDLDKCATAIMKIVKYLKADEQEFTP